MSALWHNSDEFLQSALHWSQGLWPDSFMSNQYPKQISEPRYQKPSFIPEQLRLKRRLLAVLVCGALFIGFFSVLKSFSAEPMPTTPAGFNPSYTGGYLVFYALMELSLILLSFTIGAVAYFMQGVVASVRRRQTYITCPACATRNQAKRYVEGNGCATCGSHLVYCERCGKAVDFVHFFPGKGCPACGHRFFHTR